MPVIPWFRLLHDILYTPFSTDVNIMSVVLKESYSHCVPRNLGFRGRFSMVPRAHFLDNETCKYKFNNPVSGIFKFLSFCIIGGGFITNEILFFINMCLNIYTYVVNQQIHNGTLCFNICYWSVIFTYFWVKWFDLHVLLNQIAALVRGNFSFVFLSRWTVFACWTWRNSGCSAYVHYRNIYTYVVKQQIRTGKMCFNICY
jgi:hypothetical protein